MEYGKTLIDAAGKRCGSFYKLAEEMKQSEGNISKVRAGKRQLPLEWVPELAEIAGVDPAQALARVMAERLPEGSRARAILGEVLAGGAAVMLLFFVVLGLLLPLPTYAEHITANSKHSTVYTSWNVLGRRWQAFWRFAFQGPQLLPGLSTTSHRVMWFSVRPPAGAMR